MATCITFGIQKGGVGKTTTAALSSWLLSRNSRVLAVDMDSQGNLTQVLSRRPPESFAGRTVLEALKKGRPDTYIHICYSPLRTSYPKLIDSVSTVGSSTYEEVYLKEYGDVWDAEENLNRYFRFYNTERPHGALRKRTPK